MAGALRRGAGARRANCAVRAPPPLFFVFLPTPSQQHMHHRAKTRAFFIHFLLQKPPRPVP
jgi:hypothetical protein